ncbi:branched-chain amino acid ABC transporter substrate-binding protein [Ruegeria lacuscaerulensis]|uniref:branched-chain amino acid ABC transporter substrate-binding protein n=1 Tax=Ruegeria lacuscaerulensis TaxID=55218 RepID=UPI00147E2F45|nr:branched-chain amino acid ABC transporter substrate-binding protein [Ruegeria lacuscaerulensis]
MQLFHTLVAAFGMSTLALVVPANAEIRIGTGAPLSGQYAWGGEQYRIGVDFALRKINENGGVLGEQVRLVLGDDAADPDQAVAVAKKFVSDDVVFVVGHWSSGASIPASKIYDEAGILMISPSATNTKLTDEGGPGIFRICGRDDRQGAVVGDYMAKHWPEKRISILHDGGAYGQGLAEETKKRINELGLTEVMFEGFATGEVNYSPLVDRIRAAETDILFVGGYPAEAGLILREARDQGDDLQFVSGDSLSTADYWLITGDAGEGTMFTFFPDPRYDPKNAALVEEFRNGGIEPDGYTLYAYAAVEVWAQAVEKAGTLKLDVVIASLRENEFDTVLGTLRFDENGDITDPGFSWYTWKGGEYVPLQ